MSIIEYKNNLRKEVAKLFCLLSEIHIVNMGDVENKIGKVIWPGKSPNAGYKSGLELLEEQIPQFFKKGDGKAYWFCRDVGIAKIHPGAEQGHIVNSGKQLVADGILTQEQLDYIYTQFEFDADSYHPPKWMKSG